MERAVPVENNPSRSKSVLSAVTAIPQDQVDLDWRIDNFEDAVGIAAGKDTEMIARLPFKMGSNLPLKPEGSSVPFMMELKTNILHYDDTSPSSITLYIQPCKNEMIPLPWSHLHCKFNVQILDKNQTIHSEDTTKFVSCKLIANRWDFPKLELFKYDKNFLDTCIDKHGALNLKIRAFLFYYDGTANTSTLFDNLKANNKKLEEETRAGMLESFSSLLGDRETSDVTLAIMDQAGMVVLKEFYCHRGILAARSPVFRAMFTHEEFIEKKEGLVTISDSSVEIFDQFLTFLYSGRLKNKRVADSEQPMWVKIIPDLIYIADKYEVKDLLELCETNFHLIVNKDNAADMFAFAHRHGLRKATAKLRSEFSVNLDMLLESITE